jgi:hypothetical protein
MAQGKACHASWHEAAQLQPEHTAAGAGADRRTATGRAQTSNLRIGGRIMNEHLENIYRLSCDLKLEIKKAIIENGVIRRYDKDEQFLDNLGNWALSNFHKQPAPLSEEKLKDEL